MDGLLEIRRGAREIVLRPWAALAQIEAEFFGAMLAAKDLLFLRDLFSALSIALGGATVVYSDSKSAVDMSLDPVAFKNTKHILRAAEFLRDLVAKEVLRLEHISGTYMLADLLTKAVSRPIFLQLMELLDAYARTGVSALHS